VSHQIGLRGPHFGRSTRWIRHSVWSAQNAREACRPTEAIPTARERRPVERMAPTARERRPAPVPSRPRRLARWLFVNGGISVVFLFGLMAFGVAAALFQPR
jgi:hypothetical protein